MEIITTDKKGQLATRALNLQTISAQTSSDGVTQKKAENLNVWNYSKQIIKDEYKSLVFASKRAIKDEIMLNTNINKICSWFQQTNRRPWLRIAGYIGNELVCKTIGWQHPLKNKKNEKIFNFNW